jgi:GNAT superfamily N-acetyltransferase
MTRTLVPRRARPTDADLLGQMNQRLIQDEGHRNPMTLPELQHRMRAWLAGEYEAVIFENETGVVAYALYREEPDLIHLRQLYVERGHRRKGYGLEAMQILQREIWAASKRLTVEVLTANHAAVCFWKKAGFQEYSVALEIMPDQP